MTAQVPAEGISKSKEWRDAHTYRVDCECGDDDHAVRMWIELQGDSDLVDVSVSFYVKTWLPTWDKKFSRIRTALKVLFGGELQQEHHLLLSPQVAVNFVAAMQKSIADLENPNGQHT